MTVTGEIVSMAFGGKGILRHENQVIFVPYTAPGDRITCSIVRQAKSYAEAKLLTVLKPSSQRVVPACPYFGKCGGCQLQHIDYSAQLSYKYQSVVDALQRIGKLESIDIAPIVPADSRWAYRRHITLTLQECEGRLQLGYIADDHRSFLPISQCPIFAPSDNLILQNIQEIVGELAPGKLVLFKQSDNKFYLQWHFKHLPSKGIQTLKNALSKHLEWVGCSISTASSSYEIGKQELITDVEGLSIRYSPRAFIQNHPEQSLNIYRYILNEVLKRNAASVLDLYCGIGITSLLLARQGINVIGVESNREAVKMAKANQKGNACEGASFIQADVKAVIGNLMNSRHDCAIVNPPRIGMERDVIETLRQKGPKTLVYVSCMPATLARDLKLLQERYRIEKCQPFDMFPQTGHVETVAILST